MAVIDNFKSMSFTRTGMRKKMKKLSMNMGHQNELAAFVSCVKNGSPMPVDFGEYVVTTLTTFAIVDSIRAGTSIDINSAALDAITSKSNDEQM